MVVSHQTRTNVIRRYDNGEMYREIAVAEVIPVGTVSAIIFKERKARDVEQRTPNGSDHAQRNAVATDALLAALRKTSRPEAPVIEAQSRTFKFIRPDLVSGCGCALA